MNRTPKRTHASKRLRTRPWAKQLVILGLLCAAATLGSATELPPPGGHWVESPYQASLDNCDPTVDLLCAEWELDWGGAGPKCCIARSKVGTGDPYACITPIPGFEEQPPGYRDEEVPSP
ncbi:MAG: hypothetical protein K0U98_05065 [Deltaproteobacteria bacterium]|nr:hypothetical protein [Deltaproteobacteria bacterium]